MWCLSNGLCKMNSLPCITWLARTHLHRVSHMAVSLVRFAKTPGSSRLIPLPFRDNVPVHDDALHKELRVRFPSYDTRNWQPEQFAT